MQEDELIKTMSKKILTGYPSKDDPQSINSTYFEKNPIIPNVNIYMLLKLLSTKIKDNIAVNCLNLNATYEKLIKDSLTVSLSLKELGVRKGDIVSIAMPNLYQALVSFFACNRIGAVTSFLDNNSSLEELSSYLNLFSSPIFINYNKDSEYNKKIINKTNIKHIITLDKNNINNLSLDNSYHNKYNDRLIDFSSLGSIAKERKIKLEPYHSYKEDALILFTSGSTGKPKSVVLTNENVLAAEIYAKNTSHTEDITSPTTLTCVPFSYPYGFVTSALTSLLWGKISILAPNISKDTISYYYKKNPSIIFGSPALLDLTMKNIPDNQDLSFVTHFISGGDFLTPEHAKRGEEFFKKHGADKVIIGNGCGNAETVSIGSTPVGVPLKQTTAGKILVGSKAMVVNPDTMEELKYNEEGLLCIAGRHVFKGYYNNPELTQKSKFIKDGIEYYITGTLGYIDRDGYFTVTGRQSRFYIMSSLNKVYCDNVQNIIAMSKYVADCAVVKVPDEKYLYVNKAYIVLNEQYLPTAEMKNIIIESFSNSYTSIAGKTAQLKNYEIPTYIEFVSELPRKTGTEKVDYQYLEQDALKELEQNKTKKRIK